MTCDDYSGNYTAAYLRRCALMSWRMELDRYDSLRSSAAYLSVSVPSIAVAVILATYFARDMFVYRDMELLLVALFISVMTMLACAFYKLIKAHCRYEYRALNSPQAFADCVKSYSSDFENEKEEALHFAATLEEPWQSVRSRNDRIQKMLSDALYWIVSALVLIVAWLFVGWIVLIAF